MTQVWRDASKQQTKALIHKTMDVLKYVCRNWGKRGGVREKKKKKKRANQNSQLCQMSSERVDRIKESPDSCTLSCVGFRMRSMGPFTVESLSVKGQMVNTRDQCVVRLTLTFGWQMRPEFLHYHPCWVKGSTAASPSGPRDPRNSNARGISR